jgi:hypothetical protein
MVRSQQQRISRTPHRRLRTITSTVTNAGFSLITTRHQQNRQRHHACDTVYSPPKRRQRGESGRARALVPSCVPFRFAINIAHIRRSEIANLNCTHGDRRAHTHAFPATSTRFLHNMKSLVAHAWCAREICTGHTVPRRCAITVARKQT